MARMNNFVKFSMINLNIIASMIGLAMFGFAFYLWFSDWGALDKGFFEGIGAAVFLFGLCILFGSCIGCQGISNQTVKFGGFWTGRKIIGIHLMLLIAGLAVEIYILRSALSAVQQYDIVADELDINPTVQQDFVVYEDFISVMFNRFFFGAASECSMSAMVLLCLLETLYYWFWHWVDNNCPTTISSSNCQGCEGYSLTFCEADSDMCFSSDTDHNPYCPYTICRSGILHYARKRILPFSIFFGILVIFQIILILLDFMILCFHPRDTLEQILYKSGTLGKLKHSNPV